MNVDLAAVGRVLANAGIHLSRPVVISAGRSLVIADGSTVLRISPDHPHEEEEALHVTRQLAALRAPVAEPLSTRVVSTVIGTVTFWPLLTPSPSPLRDLGNALGQLHRMPTAHLGNRSGNRERIFFAVGILPGRGLPAAITTRLTQLVELLPARPGWHAEPGVVVHGDAHPANVMRSGDRAALIDIGGVHIAPWQLDLIPVWCNARRSGGDWQTWYELKDAYGEDLTAGLWDWPHLTEAVLERELVTTLFLAEQWNLRPWVRDEIAHRLDTWDSADATWNTGA
jgi:aminoglycoside phosphotransferase (APT) family kinase protein